MRIDAAFEKVSFPQFEKDWRDRWIRPFAIHSKETIRDIYDGIKLPSRGTSGSAGYDFCIPCDCDFTEDDEVLIPTGVRCKIPEGYFLMIVPRSGLGFKYGVHLINTCGIIDSDYYGAENEGHIAIKMVRNKDVSTDVLHLKAGDKIAQGILVPYGITSDDNATAVRSGGFGSTGLQSK